MEKIVPKISKFLTNLSLSRNSISIISSLKSVFFAIPIAAYRMHISRLQSNRGKGVNNQLRRAQKQYFSVSLFYLRKISMGF